MAVVVFHTKFRPMNGKPKNANGVMKEGKPFSAARKAVNDMDITIECLKNPKETYLCQQLQAENERLKQALQNEKDKTAGKCIDAQGHIVDVPKDSFLDGVTFEDDY